MKFSEFSEMIKDVPVSASLGFKTAIACPFHPDRSLPGVASIGEASGVVRIPPRAVNPYGKSAEVVAVARGAFAGREDVTDIALPSTVQRICAGAFAGCRGLRRITIPKRITAIRAGTFAGCEALEDVYYEGSPEEWQKVAIEHQKHEVEFGDPVPGTPVREILAERLVHIPGNDALFTCNLHFHCKLE